jgi:amino acid adenylation domain-containing protein
LRFEKSEVEQSIAARFALQVSGAPDGVAVETDETQISYRELDRQSNRIARALLAKRGEEAEPVGLLFDQGPASIAAILGVLKAGKFYVPLDPSHPAARNRRIIADARVPLLLTDARRRELAHELEHTHRSILDLDRLDPQLPDAPLELRIDPAALAYVFYTSGSTGEPKGVLDTQRNVLHNVMRYTNSLHICSEDRLTLLQSCSFSGTVSSLFGALLNGATLLPFDLSASTPARLAAWLERRRGTIFHGVPSIFRSLLEAGEQGFESLRVIRLEGDKASPRDLELHRERFPASCVLVNGLGTTETGLVTQYFVDPQVPFSGSVVPVGYAVEDMQVCVVDSERRPVPAGVTGEIAVCSRYLSPGYLGRPDLTRERFVEGPAASGADRVYLTGDLGRMRPDGCLEHLGRTDARVKLRGQPVELAEVEAALQALDGVKEAAVAVREDDRGEPAIVAYVVPLDGLVCRGRELRRALMESLPPYMIPSRYMTLERLPQGANGKLDRRALPPLSSVRREPDPDFRTHRDLIERRLTQIWRELLDVDVIGVTDDFFELGGHSLAAVQMLDRISQSFDVPVSGSTLLSEPTIEHLAAVLRREADVEPIVALQPHGTQPPLYFLHGDYNAGGLYCRGLVRELGPDQPVFGLSPLGLDGGEVPRSYPAMARVHLEHLRAHRPHGPYRLGGTCNGGLVAFEMAQQLEAEGERVERLILISASASNGRYRRLRSATDRLAWIGVRARLRRALFLRLRQISMSLQGRSPAERLGYVMRKLSRIPGLLGEIHGFTETATSGVQAGGFSDLYHQIDDEYVPGPHFGPLILITGEDDPEPPDEMAACWRRLGADVELHRLPGTHQDALTENMQLLAEALRAALAEAD